MKSAFLYTLGAGLLVFAALTGWRYFSSANLESAAKTLQQIIPERKKSPAELRAEALEKSKNIKGLYMTADVASYDDAGARRIRENIIRIADETEINGIVIDVKEVCGPDYDAENLKKLIAELHKKQIWAIARIVAFKDSSQINVHPEWYLKRASAVAVSDQCARKTNLRAPGTAGNGVAYWRDNKGGYWFDPASRDARQYIADFAKKIIDLGFDEIQFDYIRFPSDGDVAAAIYPAWTKKTAKDQVMKSFFEFLGKELRAHKPDIILSADLFGYAAIRAGDVGIGQRLEDIGSTFDYVSFMVYPSHYYSGLYLEADPAYKLGAVNLDKNGARRNPGTVVYRSSLVARNFLDELASTTASTTPVEKRHEVRLRPWLEDFFHDADKSLGNPYGAKKVRLQIDGAEKVEPHGWLLWNASNVYTEPALKRE